MRRLATPLLLAAAALGLFVLLVRIALEKGFSIDEFQYAHAAWLIADGQLPYRDFFEVHFPLVYLLGAPVFAAAGDDPTAIVLLRWLMLAFALVACASVAALNRGRSWIAVALGPMLLVATSDWTVLATEIRPDALAAAFFVASLAVLRWRSSTGVPCAAVGVLAGLSAISAQKAAFYVTLTFAAVVVIDILRTRSGRARIVSSWTAFAAGGVAGLLPLLVLLAGDGMIEAFWEWTVAWGVAHQQSYPGFPWTQEALPIAGRSVPLLLLAAVGLYMTIRERDDWELVAALVATFLSAALQTAPFRYSFIPVLVLLAVFAARGAGALLQARLRVAAALVVSASLLYGGWTLSRRLVRDNQEQLRTLADIGRLTGPRDAAYDNSGSFVARPHVDFYFYTDKFLRRSDAERLSEELPARLIERGTVLKLADAREEELPPKLRAFLADHFHPWSGDIALWGQRYEATEGAPLEATFLAPKHARYFVEPADVLEEGQLTIDGAPVTTTELTLEKGTHRLRYIGPARRFHLLWLPADGGRWTPVPDAPARFSRIFY